MMTDPIADLLTRIRNGQGARKERVDVPFSRLKERLVALMKAEGFIGDYSVLEAAGRRVIRVRLRYGDAGQPVIRGIRRVSRPGLRVFVGAREIPPVQRGVGVSVLTTSRGVMVDREARQQGVGGEILCSLW